MKQNGKPDKKYLRKQIWKLEYAAWAFENAGVAAQFLYQHVKQIEHPLYYPLISSVCVLYAKPFTNNNIIGKLQGAFEKFPDDRLRGMHQALWDARNIFYAHQDPMVTYIDPSTKKERLLCQVMLHVSYEQRPEGRARLTRPGFSVLNIRIDMMPEVTRLCELQHSRAHEEIEKLINLYFAGENPAEGPHWIEVER